MPKNRFEELPAFKQHFEDHLSNQDLEVEVPTKLEMEREQSAREIAREGGFENILGTLKDRGLFEEQKSRVLSENPDVFELEFMNLPKNAQVVDALVALELYDPTTFEHSLGTFRIAKEELEKELDFDGQKIIIAERIKKEGLVDLDEFYLACLLHDIGKIEIPHFIISSEIKHSEWIEMLLDHDEKNGNNDLLYQTLEKSGLEIPEEIMTMPEYNPEQMAEKKSALMKFLLDNNVRAFDFVPIEEAVDNPLLGNRAFSQEDIAEMEQRFASRGITRKTAFFDLIKNHEKDSFKIIKDDLNMPRVAILVGAHHDYEGKYEGIREDFPTTISSLIISNKLEEILRTLDKYQAIKSKRSYKGSENKLEALVDLSHEIDGKKICYFIGYIIIKNELDVIRGELDAEDTKKAEKLDLVLQSFKEKI